MKNAYICSKPEIMINVKFVAYDGAPEKLFKSGKEKFLARFPDIEFEFFAPNPDILVFLSGGSEQKAIAGLKPGNFYLLTAFEENNSYAAASEVKARLDQLGIPSMLTDLHEPHDRKIILRYIRAKQGVRSLNGKTLGLIGEVSPWLLASTIESKVLKKKLGINLRQIPWEKVQDFADFTYENSFLEKYQFDNKTETANAARIHEALNETVQRENLDAFTIECFSLVKEKGVTACLSLSEFNDRGLPAGCEGDLCSITGMMLVQAVTGTIPWMANLIRVSLDCVRFAHCTAPTNLLEQYEVDTHYETGLGTAVAGTFRADSITVFRFDNSLSKAFISEGTVISTHKANHACRTQIEVSIPEKDAELLKHHPLGNHHLIIPGHHRSLLKMACKVSGLRVVNPE